MKRFFGKTRSSAARQGSFEFLDRSRRRQRCFKLGILVATCLAIAFLLGVLPRGRYVVASAPSLARQTFRNALGIPTPRSEIDEGWRRFRLQGIADSRKALPEFYEKAGPRYQRFLRYAGMDPEHALLRWGNYDRTLLLPSKIFEADDAGRSYRFRPCTEAIWVRDMPIQSDVLTFYLVPDGPDLPKLITGTPAWPVKGSGQTVNSWGLRGPEPDLLAPVRGIVLGDSFMQGMFIGDDETPPECLRRDLEERLNAKVSILNTGVLGYSTEQYYYSLLAFVDRFRPQFVVVSVFGNDFANEVADVVIKGQGDWEEGKFWLGRIIQFCLSRGLTYLVVPVPHESTLLGRRRAGHYPGTISNISEATGLTFLDPSDDLLNAHLELVVAAERIGKRPFGCPLFNVQINDGHFSALGSKIWAQTVGRRLTLLLDGNPAITMEKH